jgi:hypothetical protein
MHPQLGPLRLNYTNLWLSQRVGTRLVTYTPADERTTTALQLVDDLEPRPLYPG